MQLNLRFGLTPPSPNVGSIFIAPSKYRTDRFSPTPEFYVGGHQIEFTDHWPHLGHIIDNNSDDQEDILQQRNELCGQFNNVLCFFSKRDPFVKFKLLLSYCFSPVAEPGFGPRGGS
jgi:hypothetical protein